jgi:pyocin large subunit-like protein
MTPYTFEEIQFLNKPTQEENMFTPKFEIPSYEEAKKATENFAGQVQKFWADAFKDYAKSVEAFFQNNKK